MTTVQIETETSLGGEVQVVRPRQRLFYSWEEATSFIKMVRPKRVLIEASTTQSRQPAWVVEYSGTEGEE